MSWAGSLLEEILGEFEEAQWFGERRLVAEGLTIFSDRTDGRQAWREAHREHCRAYARAYARRPGKLEERRARQRAKAVELAAAARERWAKHKDTIAPRVNAQRRERYRSDPAYREAVLAPQREAHRSGDGARTQRARAAAAATCACGAVIKPPERGVIPKFCSRRCRDAATRAARRQPQAPKTMAPMAATKAASTGNTGSSHQPGKAGVGESRKVTAPAGGSRRRS
ncbi:MAG: hypothetical protein ACTHU0_21885 [Kofleriaceae bacterium]